MATTHETIQAPPRTSPAAAFDVKRIREDFPMLEAESA